MAERRVLVVTGASSGIGRALALAGARDGFAVLAIARRADRLAALCEEIAARGGTCTTLVLDVRSPEAPARIAETALQIYGRIDVVVNNAGGGSLGALLEVGDAEIEAQWQLHVAAPLRIARAALPQLRATRGQLVFVGSGLARVPVPNYGAYAPAKAAIRAAAIQLRRELRADGIAVTYVDPGLVASEFHAAMGIARSNDVPAATPERVARAILRGIARRSPSVAGVPWQTAGTILGEWSSTLADPTLIRMAPQPRHPERRPPSERTEPKGPMGDGAPAGLDAALEPVARRMERVKLSPTFVREALAPGAELELNEVAMRWAGMPNKNERAALREVFEALAAAGYLEQTGDDTWKVLRAAD
ncbi:MAG TPA: SDR family NAD(P)-dependent oxidoreductase [Verrucomicrobiae bacterium]|nr:SDR family NAD(P)-dependent oxidoreductase [Verrucomicrobiae bacterium]